MTPAKVILVNDTGAGTTGQTQGSTWNIKNFLDHHLNPGGNIPYLVVVSHCHWDHILGLPFILPSVEDTSSVATESKVDVMSSSYDPTFLAPYGVLVEHSLCKANSKETPVYQTSMWAGDFQKVLYSHPAGVIMNLPVVTIHTPGHTPDSLTWFDTETRTLYVGDSVYQQETDDSRLSPWGREAVGPVMFTNEGNLLDWWRSIDKLIIFAEKENIPGKPRLKLASGHVTSAADAHACLTGVKSFMARVLRNEVASRPMGENRGKPMAHWTDDPEEVGDTVSEFSVGAPIFVIEEGRRTIPREEWS